jgi:hypothetical protein
VHAPEKVHHGGVFVALAGRVESVQPVAEGGIGLGIQVAVAVHGEAHRGMPGPGGDLLGVGAGRDPQGDGRVAKVVDAQAIQPGVPGRWPPDASPEGDHPQRPALRGREHKGVRWGRRCQVGGQLLDHGPGESDGAAAGAGLGRPYAQPATHLGNDLGDLDRASQQVDPAAAQAGQLPDPQAAVGADQDQGAIAGADGVGEPGDLDRVRNRISSRSILGRGTRWHGDWAIMPASTVAASTLPRRW